MKSRSIRVEWRCGCYPPRLLLSTETGFPPVFKASVSVFRFGTCLRFKAPFETVERCIEEGMTRIPLSQPVAELDLPEGFALPDWDRPFDPAAYFGIVPEYATAKGMFVQALLDEADRLGIALELDQRYYPFLNYPLRECMEITLKAAATFYPESSPRDGLRRVARLSYTTFAASMIGRVVFGIAGQDVGRILKLASKGASIASTVGKMEVVDLQEHSAVLRVAEIYIFAECFNVGMAEGVLSACGRDGYVAQRMRSLTEGDFYICWG